MNTRKGMAKFKSYQIMLDNGCSSMIVMGNLVEKLCLKKYAVMQYHTQAGNITTDLEVKVDFTLLPNSATDVMTWKCHVDESAKGKYDMILGQYLLT